MTSATKSMVAGGAVLTVLILYVSILLAQGDSAIQVGTVMIAAAAVTALVSAGRADPTRRWLLATSAALLLIWGVLGLASIGVAFLVAGAVCLWAMITVRSSASVR
ncbi:MAG: hypothetical protein ACR2HR_05915 [Euzebya sp.]